MKNKDYETIYEEVLFELYEYREFADQWWVTEEDLEAEAKKLTEAKLLGNIPEYDDEDIPY